MIDLAEHAHEGRPIPIKDIVQRQGISHKYIEHVMSLLTKSGLVNGLQGKGGGYKLNRDPAACIVWDILQATEISLAPVACLQASAAPCPRAHECRTLPMWNKLDALLQKFFQGITLADLMQNDLTRKKILLEKK